MYFRFEDIISVTKHNSRIDSTRETIYAAPIYKIEKNEVNNSDRIVNLFNYGDKFGNSVNGTRSRSSFEQSFVDFEQTLLIPNTLRVEKYRALLTARNLI